MLTIDIFNSGEAFDEPAAELARILRRLAQQIEDGTAPETLRDINGNRCGTVELSPFDDLENDE